MAKPNFIQRLYEHIATEQDMKDAKRRTIVIEDPICKCGHRAFNHSWWGTREDSKCHKYGCACESFKRA